MSGEIGWTSCTELIEKITLPCMSLAATFAHDRTVVATAMIRLGRRFLVVLCMDGGRNFSALAGD